MRRRFNFGRKSILTGLLLGALLLLVSACASDQTPSTDTSKTLGAEKKVEVMVSAAASLKSSLEETGRRFEAEFPNVTLRYNFGGSGSLGQQLEQGAP